MFEIRTATIAESKSIQQVYQAVSGAHAEADETHWDQLIRTGGIVVAQTAAAIIGFGGIDVQAPEQMKWLYLLPQYQRSGIGSRLLQRLEHIGWDAGLNSIRLHAAPAAVDFYRKHGYAAVEPAEQLGHDHAGVEMIKARLPQP